MSVRCHLQYVPHSNYNGNDTFEYGVSDCGWQSSRLKTITVPLSVHAVGDNPGASNIQVHVAPGQDSLIKLPISEVDGNEVVFTYDPPAVVDGEVYASVPGVGEGVFTRGVRLLVGDSPPVGSSQRYVIYAAANDCDKQTVAFRFGVRDSVPDSDGVTPPPVDTGIVTIRLKCLRPCGRNDWTFTHFDCNPQTVTHPIKFYWPQTASETAIVVEPTVSATGDDGSGSEVAGFTCVIVPSVPLPGDGQIFCEVAPSGSTESAIIVVCVVISSSLCGALLFWIFMRRHEPVVALSQPIFLGLFALGGLLTCLSSLTLLAPLTNVGCMLPYWVIPICITFMVAPLFVKTYRVFKVGGACVWVVTCLLCAEVECDV